MSPSLTLSVWYIAAGYKLPAGIEAYLLHYATELRNQGFEPRIIVFEPLPEVPHRFLLALRERGIPIESLYERVSPLAKLFSGLTYIPWKAVTLTKRSLVVVAAVLSGALQSPGLERQDAAGDSGHYNTWLAWWTKRLAVNKLKHMIEREKPDIIHVKGRLITEAWPVFPVDRTLYQHALMGTRDPSWTDVEAEAFSVFLNRVAKVLVQGKGIAKTFAHAFDIRREIDVVFTMAPDELAPEARAQLLSCSVVELLSEESPKVSAISSTTEQLNNLTTDPKPRLRFGILSRFTEQKGISYILEALKMYKDRHGAVDFTFAGQGPLEQLILKTVADCQVAELFSERPEVSSINSQTTKQPNNLATNAPAGGIRIVPVTTAVDILRELDVFVHPGLDDAMPVSIVEALMCGVPCIVSNVGASPELVRDGVEGIVIEPASAEQILMAMERFSAMTGEELAGFRTRARVRYEAACRPEVVGAKVAGIYREIVGII